MKKSRTGAPSSLSHPCSARSRFRLSTASAFLLSRTPRSSLCRWCTVVTRSRAFFLLFLSSKAAHFLYSMKTMAMPYTAHLCRSDRWMGRCGLFSSSPRLFSLFPTQLPRHRRSPGVPAICLRDGAAFPLFRASSARRRRAREFRSKLENVTLVIPLFSLCP